jgi:hypothetical protein
MAVFPPAAGGQGKKKAANKDKGKRKAHAVVSAKRLYRKSGRQAIEQSALRLLHFTALMCYHPF